MHVHTNTGTLPETAGFFSPACSSPQGVGQHVALGRRAGIHGQRVVNGQLAEAARERGLGRNREHPTCARTRPRPRRAAPRSWRQANFFFSRTFFCQAAVKQGETRDRSLRARRPTGIGQDIALQRRAGVRVANVGGELAEARSERSLRCDCEHLPPPAPGRRASAGKPPPPLPSGRQLLQ